MHWVKIWYGSVILVRKQVSNEFQFESCDNSEKACHKTIFHGFQLYLGKYGIIGNRQENRIKDVKFPKKINRFFSKKLTAWSENAGQHNIEATVLNAWDFHLRDTFVGITWGVQNRF